MALKKTWTTEPRWETPVWPDRLPDADEMRAVYGAFADELVIRFSPTHHHDMVIVVPITTPETDYAGVLVAADSGAIIGVHVMPLAAYAAKLHPEWKLVGVAEPAPDAVRGLVEDIKNLFERFGIEDPNPD